MRLIDELLKDDFFHGGYQPVEAPAAPVAAASGKKPVALIAGIAAGVLLLGGGAAFFVLKGKPAEKAEPPTQTAAVVPPNKVRPPVTTATAATTGTAPVTAAVAAAPATAPAPAQTAAAPTPEPAPAAEPAKPAEPKYRIVMPQLTDRAAVDKVLAELKKKGVKATSKEGAEKSLVFEVASDPAASGAANALKLKASLFKIEATVVDQGGGQFIVSFGKYRTKSDAQKVVDALAKFSAKAGIQETTIKLPIYEIRAGGLTQALAEEAVSSLSAAGYDASMERQK